MDGKILRFETLEDRFLRETADILSKLQNRSNPLEQNISLLDDLNDLYTSYKESLPIKYSELLYVISLLSSSEDAENISKSDFLNDAILLCKITNQKPCIDLFVSMALNHFDFLCSQFEFPESMVVSIIEYLVYVQTNAKVSDILQPIAFLTLPDTIDQEFKKYCFNTRQIYKLWIALANLKLSDDLMIRIIKSSKLSDSYFVDFCSNILLSYSQNEAILSELIDYINVKRIYKSSFKTRIVKTQLYSTIISAPQVPENIIKKIVGIIPLDLDIYYTFFYELLKEYSTNTEIRNEIIARLNNDKPNMPNTFIPYIMRLLVLAINY